MLQNLSLFNTPMHACNTFFQYNIHYNIFFSTLTFICPVKISMQKHYTVYTEIQLCIHSFISRQILHTYCVQVTGHMPTKPSSTSGYTSNQEETENRQQK